MRNRAFLLKAFSALLLLSVGDARAQGVYYVDAASGSDQNPGTSETMAWRTVARVNSGSFAPGDRILFRRGQVWKETLVITWSGSPGRPVYFGAYGSAKSNPRFYGAEAITNWSAAGPNLWSAPLPADPRQVFFNNVRGTKMSAIANVASPRQWCWASNTITIYSASDPAVAYHDPGIEASVRSYGAVEPYGARSYVTIDSIDMSKSGTGGLWFSYPAASNIVIKNLTSEFSGDGIYINSTNITVSNVHLHGNGISQYDHGIYVVSDGFTIENCVADSNSGAGIHAYQCGSGTIRGNFTFGNGNTGDGWGIVVFDIQAGKKIDVAYNVVHSNTYYGLTVQYAKPGDTVNVYNNVVSNNGVPGYTAGLCLAHNDPASLVRVKNNLSYENRTPDFEIIGSTAPYQIDYNLYFRRSGTLVNFAGRSFTASQFSAYQAASGLEGHSLSSDPILVDPVRGDFRISSASPCVNRGTNVGLAYDIRGVPVPANGSPDIGAYELGLAAPPSVLSPLKGATNQPTTLRIRWSRVPEASSYRVQVSADSSFRSTVLDSAVTDTSLQIRQLGTAKRYYLRVQSSNSLGTGEFSPVTWFSTGTTGVQIDGSGRPEEFGVLRNYPNPFNPATTIEFSLGSAAHTVLTICDVLGANVATLLSEYLDAGIHRVTWNAFGLSSGVYFLRLQSGEASAVRRVNLLR